MLHHSVFRTFPLQKMSGRQNASRAKRCEPTTCRFRLEPLYFAQKASSIPVRMMTFCAVLYWFVPGERSRGSDRQFFRPVAHKQAYQYVLLAHELVEQLDVEPLPRLGYRCLLGVLIGDS